MSRAKALIDQLVEAPQHDKELKKLAQKYKGKSAEAKGVYAFHKKADAQSFKATLADEGYTVDMKVGFALGSTMFLVKVDMKNLP